MNEDLKIFIDRIVSFENIKEQRSGNLYIKTEYHSCYRYFPWVRRF